MKENKSQYKQALRLVVVGILLIWSLDNLGLIKNLLLNIVKILKPIILALIIAFLFDGPMGFIERLLVKVFPSFKNRPVKRIISYLISLVIFIFLLGLIIFIIVPELVETSKILGKDIYDYIMLLIREGRLDILLEKLDMEYLSIKLDKFLKNDLIGWVNTSLFAVANIFNQLANLILSFILSIYILMQKESLKSQLIRLTYAYLPVKLGDRIIEVANLSKKTFKSFINGQVLESSLLGLVFFIVMGIFNLPYKALISLVIGITSLIPTVGAFIGCGFGILLISINSFNDVLVFLIIFIIIQQIDSNIIYPKIVGKASGLSSFCVMVAIILGGSMFGILGMVTFIPIFSIIGKLLNEDIDKRLNRKGVDIKLE